MNKRSSPGYILVLSISIVGILMLLITLLYQRSKNHFYFIQTSLQREKAILLAQSGLELAMSHLSLYKSKQEEAKKQSAAGGASEKKAPNRNLLLLKRVLPTLNHWQTFELKQDIDGIDGQLKLCISCEDGKLDINALYDFKNKKFIGESSEADTIKMYKSLFSTLKKVQGGRDLFELFEKFLKQRQYKLNDVTELLSVEEFQKAFKNHIFYEPQQQTKKGRAVYLTDIFTLWSGKKQINPWLLSESWITLLGLKPVRDTMDSAAYTQEIEQLLTPETPVTGAAQKIWDSALQKLYTKDFKSLPSELATLLSASLPLKTFSILAYGTVGSITQKLYALVERHDEQPCTLKKVYWL